ncbi:glycosyltransferase [Mixta sp. Marseille-Q2659]|uniref:glycosyltransferase n=1 Tax=Mixta sp. Marseille-Q2659 TaxID=2736607 RepID=UPI0023B99F57|nr:glycosyltransferase [Mixta sp. Marseille-Q2659]
MFSVVMSVYNAELFLKKAIESILEQSFKDFEFIIIDDGSTDESIDIIKEFASLDPRIIYRSRENKGLITSLNEAINLSSYEYIVRMDADDISAPERLQKIADVIKNNPAIDLISSASILIDMNDDFICYSPHNLNEEKILSSLPGKNFIIHPAVAFKKCFFFQCGGYNIKDNGIEDVALWLRMKQNKVKYKFIGQSLLRYRININSVRKVNSEKYREIIFKECLVNHDKKSAIKKFKTLPNKYKFFALLLLFMPSPVLDSYTKMRNKKKIWRVYNGRD